MSDQAPQLFDPGLQPERTLLAWRRTALSIVVGSLVTARLLYPQLGIGAVILGVVGASGGLAVHLLAGRRLRRMTHQLLGHPTVLSTTGGLLATAAAACATLGALSAALVVLSLVRATG